MKKFLSIFLVLVLVLSALSVFAGCVDKDDDKDDKKDNKKDNTTVVTTTEAVTTAPQAPAGYKLYNGDGFYIAYPETWADSGLTSMILFQNASTGSSFNIVSEAKTDVYDNMTVASFNSTYKPIYEQMGMNVSNAKVDYETIDGVKVLNLSFDAVMNGVSMKMAQFVFTLGENTYSITVSEVSGADSGVAVKMFESLGFEK